MQLKPFTAGYYDDDAIVIGNPENGRQELFSREEFEIVKFLKQNERESLLALLLPNIGIAKKDHIVICLAVVGKLLRLGIVDYFELTGRKPVEGSPGALEVEAPKAKISFPGVGALAAVFIAISNRALGWLGGYGLFFLAFALAAFGLMFFPFPRMEAQLAAVGISYPALFLGVFFGGCAGLSLRTLLQSAYLRSFGGEVREPGVDWFLPFVCLAADKRSINFAGLRARVQMGILGLLAPLALTAPITALALGGILDAATAYFIFAGCLLATLLLLSPFLQGDGAEILHSLLRRGQLRETVAAELRGIFRARNRLSRDRMVSLVAASLWLLVWFDGVRAFWETIVAEVGGDLYGASFTATTVGAWLVVLTLWISLLMPALVFSHSLLRRMLSRRRRRIVLEEGKASESLNEQERLTALERIPLFSCLSEQERLGLLAEMQAVYFPHGEPLVRQGEVGRELFVLAKGHAKVFFHDVNQRRMPLAELQTGDAFGEIALIDDVPRTASVVSEGGCIALVLRKESFDRFADSLGSAERVKTMIRLTSFFRRHPLFAKLGTKDQAELIDSFHFETLTVGEEIPDNDDSFFVVYSGEVRVDTGDDRTDTRLTCDDCFGYANALNARYFAAEGAGLLSVRRGDFYSLIWEKLVTHPELFV